MLDDIEREKYTTYMVIPGQHNKQQIRKKEIEEMFFVLFCFVYFFWGSNVNKEDQQ